MFGEEFDFEEDVERSLPKITDDTITAEIGSCKVGDQKHRIIVCRHWLVGLCHNGNMCSYLHRLDRNRMPPCKHGPQCKIKNCPLRHVADEELEECTFYKQGFCYNGPKCTRKHVKRTPEQCPAEYPFELVSAAQTQASKRLKAGQPNDNFKVTLCTHWLLRDDKCPFGAECHYAHGEAELREGFQSNSEFLHDEDIYDPTRNIIGVPLELPIQTQSRCAYFILQSPDLRSLLVSRRRGVWAVPSRIAHEMNAVYRSMDHVILFFSVRALRGIYGVARMSGAIPHVPQSSPLTPEFSVTWLRTMRVALSTVGQLKLGSSGMFVGRSSMDGRFDSRVGLDMLLTAFRKPAWDWTQEMARAEQNIRLVDPALLGAPNAAPPGEYYPQGGQSAYYLPEDVLFAQDWIERAGLDVNEKGFFSRPPRDSFSSAGAHHNINRHQNGEGGFHAQSAPLQPPAEFYRGPHSGFIVCAPTATVEEMFQRMMLGLPAQFADVQIHPNVPLFIFDTQANIMLGIFYANSAVTMNMDPRAFCGWGQRESALPVQLHFKHALECPPIQIQVQDPDLRAALGESLHNMGQISVDETKALANLFARRAFAAYPRVLASLQQQQGQGQGYQQAQQQRPGGPRGQFMGGAGVRGGGGYYKPPFRHVEVVPVDILGNHSEIKRRLLGNNASTIIQIVDSLGSKQTVRVRIRGIGSGFIEGPNQVELPEPLHFNVSAENEQLLAAVVERLKEHIAKVKREMGPQ